MSRKTQFKDLTKLIGSMSFRVMDTRDGWPGTGIVKCSSHERKVAIHIGPIGLSNRNRDDVERRFQNPGQKKPLLQLDEHESFLIGVWKTDPKVAVSRAVFAAMQVTPERLTRNTRQSFFIPLRLLQAAETSGWAEHVNDAGEKITAFLPQAFPAFAELQATSAVQSPAEIAMALQASGLVEDPSDHSAQERFRRQTSSLVRSGSFSKKVSEAYGGRCAMCGLNASLIEAAHIYPVAAPDSPDEIWNGLCLCRNHHGAFDRNLVILDADSLDITITDRLKREADESTAGRSLCDSTFPMLKLPEREVDYPSADMVRKRYEFFPSSMG